MRLLSRLFIIIAIIAVCLVAVALPPAPAEAQDGAYIRLYPDEGVPGEEIKVYGYNFTANKWVEIYYDADGDGRFEDNEFEIDVKTDSGGDFRVKFDVPESYTGYHEVLAEDTEDVKAYDYFDVEPGLTINTEEGPVGTTVTVEGHGFAKEEEDIELRYYLDGTWEVVADKIEAREDGYWQASFHVPSSAQGDHDIDAKGKKSSLRDVHDTTFEVTPEIYILDGPSGSIVEEPSGSPGESITITGSGFDGEDSYIKVFFEGEVLEVEPHIIRAGENGDWEASFKVPDMPAGAYSVTAEGQLTRKEDVNELTFTIAPGLVLSPEEGYVGMNLTVAGRGFTPDEYVVIKYEGSEMETTRTNNGGSFEVSFLVPESKHGARNVTAEVSGKTEAFATFIMESNAPETPELISPADGDRVGFIGRVRPTFNWTAVSDASGVYYNLQIATSDNITDTGLADSIRSIPNIVGTNYTLDKTEALPYGAYYWIVQAVDGAENAGNWTAVYSFRAGLLPLWAFIVIMVAIAAGIGTAVYFFIIRKRIYYY